MDIGIDAGTALVIAGIMIGSLATYKAMGLTGKIVSRRFPPIDSFFNGKPKNECTNGEHCGEEEPPQTPIAVILMRKDISDVKTAITDVKEAQLKNDTQTCMRLKEIKESHDKANTKLDSINNTLIALPHELANELNQR